MHEQITMVEGVEVSMKPLAVSMRVVLRRLPRQRCQLCLARRVCFAIGLADVLAGPALCAKCAGIR